MNKLINLSSMFSIGGILIIVWGLFAAPVAGGRVSLGPVVVIDVGIAELLLLFFISSLMCLNIQKRLSTSWLV
jgi:hypothetical protein